MPHKRAKRSIREQYQAGRRSDLPPSQSAFSNDDMPKSMARVLNAETIQKSWREKKRALDLEEDDQGGKRKRLKTDAATKNELKIKPGESLRHFRRRVEDDMRPVIQSAMRNTTSVSKQKNEASQKEVEYLIKKPSLKRKNVEELDGSHFDLPSARKGRGKGNREHSPEFARNSSSAPKHLNDIVQAPPVLKSASRLKRLVQKAKVDNDEGEDTGDSNNVVSNAQKRMMELEREKVIVRYRALKEMRLKQRQKVTGESGF